MTTPGPGDAGMGMPTGLVSLVAHGILDASLAATVWLLLEGGCPLVVVSPDGMAGRRLVLGALVDLYPPTRRRVEVTDLEPNDAGDVLAVGGDFGSELRTAPLDHARARALAGAISVLDRGLALAFGLEADGLEAALAALAAPPVRVSDDRISYLGLALVLEPTIVARPGSGLPVATAGDAPARSVGRVRIAHYLRPLSRDAGGHLQRLPPAVLAARDDTTGRLEDFSWGVVAELGRRVGRTASDFESEVARRADLIAGAVAGHRP